MDFGRVEDYSTEDWKKFYLEKNEYMISRGYEGVAAADFYRELFPEGSLQDKAELNDGKGNVIATRIETAGKKKTRQWIVTDGLEELENVYDIPFGLVAPLTYYGKTHKARNAHHLFAIAIDVDYVTSDQMRNFEHQCVCNIQLKPTYVVNSGRGIHCYYFLEEPIPLYHNLIDMLTELKHDMIHRLWMDAISLGYQKPDVTGIYQNFRCVGSWSKLGKEFPVVAFKMTDHRFKLDEIARHYDSKARTELVDKKPTWTKKKDRKSLAECEKQYPEWYKEKILGIERPTKFWTSNQKMYEWWKRQIEKKAVLGGRYYSLVALVSFGLKCGIEDRQIKKDAWSFYERLKSLDNPKDTTNLFLRTDVKDALKMLEPEKRKDCSKHCRQWLADHSKIEITANKRNGRKQFVHLRMARAIQQIQDEENGTKWNGRKSAEPEVIDYITRFPTGNAKDFEEKTGLKKSVYYKYKKKWDEENRLANLCHDSCEGSYILESAIEEDAKKYKRLQKEVEDER